MNNSRLKSNRCECRIFFVGTYFFSNKPEKFHHISMSNDVGENTAFIRSIYVKSSIDTTYKVHSPYFVLTVIECDNSKEEKNKFNI